MIEIPDFLTVTAKSLASSAMGIPILVADSLIIPDTVPCDMPASWAIWSLVLPLRYPCFTCDLVDWFDLINFYNTVLNIEKKFIYKI